MGIYILHRIFYALSVMFLAATLGFFLACLAVVVAIFRTGYRLKS